MSPVATDTSPATKAAILQAAVKAPHKWELPNIAHRFGMTLIDLQAILNAHGYPDARRMTTAAAALADGKAAETTPTASEAPPPTPAGDPYVTALPLSTLFADPAYQRELDELRVAKMANAYSPALVGIVEVSKRADGRYAILDGQHRAAALRDHLFDLDDVAHDPHIAARVHTGLTVAEEARLYHQLNTTRKQLTGWDRWLARRAAGDDTVAAIEQVVTDHGYTTGMRTAPGVLRATSAAETVYRKGGTALLGAVLGVVRRAWGDEQAGLDAALITGLAQVLDNYHHAGPNPELPLDRLTAALQAQIPRQLTARIPALREVTRGTSERLAAHLIVDAYNAKDRAGRLEPFLERVKPLTQDKKVRGTAERRRAAIKEWAVARDLMKPNGHVTKTVILAYEKAHPGDDSATTGAAS